MFVFYDTETTGLEKDFSQILQIALVFTDDDLNILSSKKIECRRLSWVVPSPGALLTTGFVPDDLKKGKYSHYEMMAEVDQWLRAQHWPIIFAGYNTLGFDEPVLAQNLYQNLFDPVLTTAKNGHNDQSNGRLDVMVLVKAVSLYMPDALKLDAVNEYGKPSLSLVNVARQNGVVLSDEDAHDAMNDIKATIGVAQVIRKAAPELWAQMQELATAEGVSRFLDTHGIFTFGHIAYGKTRTAVATRAVEREGDAAQILFDLSRDPAPYLSMTPEQLAEVMKQKKDSPFMVVHRNSQPILMPMEASDAVIPADFDDNVATARARVIHGDAGFQDRLKQAAVLLQQSEAPGPVNRLPEQMPDLPATEAVRRKLTDWMRDFHATESWKDAAAVLGDFYARFEDELKEDPSLRRFVKLAGRLVYEHAPEELDESRREQMKKHIASRLLNPDPKTPYMTISKARQELEQIERERAAGKERWQHVSDTQIRSIKLYYTALEKEYAPYISGYQQGGGDIAPPASKGPDTPPRLS